MEGENREEGKQVRSQLEQEWGEKRKGGVGKLMVLFMCHSHTHAHTHSFMVKLAALHPIPRM